MFKFSVSMKYVRNNIRNLKGDVKHAEAVFLLRIYKIFLLYEHLQFIN